MNGEQSDQSSAGNPAFAPNGQVHTQILQALELVHNPRTKNEQRLEALRYFEDLKSQDEAPFNGYSLASTKSNPAVVRHFGLSLIEEAIRQKWLSYRDEQSQAVRDWVIKLAQSVEKDDPLYIRNKVAQLWVDVGKRSWALDWLDMDELLVRLWDGSLAKKAFVLEVLETMSENSFGKEDTITALRGTDLSKACVEIFTPAQVIAEQFPNRDATVNVRCGDEGWIWRVSSFLGWCNEQGNQNSEAVSCAQKALSVLKSVVSWAILPAITETRAVNTICQSLTSNNQTVQLLAIETLYVLYHRSNFEDEDVRKLVGPIYEKETVDVLKQVYQWSIVPATEIDDEKYLLCKKFSETMHNVGKFLRDFYGTLPDNVDIPNFLDLLLKILQNESLHVSIPILHLWAQLLCSKPVGDSPEVLALMGPLLETCSQRLIRYELLPVDSTYPSMVFLAEDVESMPERHAFLGNYARFGKDIVENITLKRPYDALSHILGQADQVLRNPYDGSTPFNPLDYKKTSIPALKVDAQCSVVESALGGFTRWRAEQKVTAKDPAEANEQQALIESNLQKWGFQLLDMVFDDPSIHQRVVGLVVELAIGPLKRTPDFVVPVFQYLLRTKRQFLGSTIPQENVLYHEALKDLQRFCSHQLQRMSLRAADYLIGIYDNIENEVQEICQSSEVDEEDRDRCCSVLFVVVQRATTLDNDKRAEKLQGFVQHFMNKWQDPQLAEALQSFGGFCTLLGLRGFQDYFISRNAHKIQDWADVPLDDEGKALKAQIETARMELPLRSTKTYLSVSLDRSEPGTRHYDAAHKLWSQYLTIILPNVLQLIGLSHLFSEPSSWADMSPETRVIPNRILKDRFWQVGISSGSRDDFYSKVEQTKNTLEGLASCIRGSLRFARETSYRLICTLSSLKDTFYSIEELPGPLSRALFENAGALSTHQNGIVIDMVKPVIENCPTERRTDFLTPLLTEMFNSLDGKVRTEWNRIDQRNKAAAADDDLVEEMKDESILRQLTFNCVTIVARLFDPNDGGSTWSRGPSNTTPLRLFVLGNPQVFKSVILFCTHALEMHDSRACGLITRVLRTIIPHFTKDDAVTTEIREFISTEVLKACISSLHDHYFVDIQSDLATLIASILNRYSSLTDTPRDILLSLPNMSPEAVSGAIFKLYKADGNSRQQRAVVLKLLEGLRGISISEQGRYPKIDVKKARTAMQEKYMSVEANQKARTKDDSPDLGGVSDMFA